MDEPIGVYTEMKEDDVGLYVRGRLLIDDDPLAKRAHAHMKAGSLTGLSIGYVLKDWEYDRSKEAFLLKEIDLWEVSLVTFPSNDEARISDVKNDTGPRGNPRTEKNRKSRPGHVGILPYPGQSIHGRGLWRTVPARR